MGVDAERRCGGARILENLRPGKPISEGRKLFFDMREEYYQARGWMKTESPPGKNCFSLGLKEAAEKIKRKIETLSLAEAAELAENKKNRSIVASFVKPCSSMSLTCNP